jgi:hypothetical protein
MACAARGDKTATRQNRMGARKQTKRQAVPEDIKYLQLICNGGAAPS